jgi:hypothetical protein
MEKTSSPHDSCRSQRVISITTVKKLNLRVDPKQRLLLVHSATFSSFKNLSCFLMIAQNTSASLNLQIGSCQLSPKSSKPNLQILWLSWSNYPWRPVNLLCLSLLPITRRTDRRCRSKMGFWPHLRDAPSHLSRAGGGDLRSKRFHHVDPPHPRNNHLSRRTSRFSKCPILARGRLPLGKGGQTVTAELGGKQPEGRRVR